ncbi:MAG TPA: glycosyltransferase, partial [Polyangiaceae bacterium]
MSASRLEVVVRCKNEMPWVSRTMAQLERLDADLLVIDSGSTDGSLEVVEKSRAQVVRITPESYVPGRVLNDAMKRTRGDVVAFVNADAIPLHDGAVEALAAACRAGAAASYGRQVARAQARTSTRIDYQRCFPDDPRGPGFGHFFSMAASAVRRDVWEAISFDERLRYSEDVDWTWRLKAMGLRVDYVPSAAFEHSHDYDLRAMYRRMYGEGTATPRIFRTGAPKVARGFLAPLAAQVARDALKHGALSEVGLRVVAQVGRLRG